MVLGVTLFLQLIRAIAVGDKLRHPCPACRLPLHDRDAAHCKRCGANLFGHEEDSEACRAARDAASSTPPRVAPLPCLGGGQPVQGARKRLQVGGPFEFARRGAGVDHVVDLVVGLCDDEADGRRLRNGVEPPERLVFDQRQFASSLLRARASAAVLGGAPWRARLIILSRIALSGT